VSFHKLVVQLVSIYNGFSLLLVQSKRSLSNMDLSLVVPLFSFCFMKFLHLFKLYISQVLQFLVDLFLSSILVFQHLIHTCCSLLCAQVRLRGNLQFLNKSFSEIFSLL